MNTIMILNKVMGDIIKIVKSLEKLALLIKGVSKSIQNETKRWIS